MALKYKKEKNTALKYSRRRHFVVVITTDCNWNFQIFLDPKTENPLCVVKKIFSAPGLRRHALLYFWCQTWSLQHYVQHLSKISKIFLQNRHLVTLTLTLFEMKITYCFNFWKFDFDVQKYVMTLSLKVSTPK